MRIGKLSEIRRYPIKSMLGEVLVSSQVLTRGIPGDRVCALIDRLSGKVASAKLPQRWRRLLECTARFNEAAETIEIDLPDGQRIAAADEASREVLSAFLGREIDVAFSRPDNLELERANPEEVAVQGATSPVGAAVLAIGSGAPEGGFFDAVPIHFINSASLDRVAEVSLSKTSEAVRFRPNFVFETEGLAPFVENDWVGWAITIGQSLKLRVLLPTPRCAVPTLSHGEVPPDPRLTMAIADLNRAQIFDMGMLPCLGGYAHVEQAGPVAIGDEIVLHPPG